MREDIQASLVGRLEEYEKDRVGSLYRRLNGIDRFELRASSWLYIHASDFLFRGVAWGN